MISVDEALARIFSLVPAPEAETVSLAEAAGRVLAAPLTAAHSQPPFDASAMDGYAVRAGDVIAGRSLRLIGTAQAGQRFSGMMGPGQCVRIFTGAPLPIGADTVIIQEEATANGAQISFAAQPIMGQCIRQRGSAFAEGEALLAAGTLLTPARLTLAAAANRARLTVARRPRVALLATGDELVVPGTALGPDQIVASNSYGLAPLFAPASAEVVNLGIVPDDLGGLTARLHEVLATGIDVLVTTGGASVGDRDYMREALAALGVSLDFWKIAIRPGKPLMFGRHGKTLIFGLPGNPVSAIVTGAVVVLPALRHWAGQADPLGIRLRLPLAAPLPANGDRRHFIRARLEPAPGGTRVMPFGQTDSGQVALLAAADGLLIQPENDAGLPAGAAVDFMPL
ncbi:MAG: molybdopterin molybdotransferase MoeA [Devosia sp.]|nr:molybdopterin molybdotransferase MoeA [Devosia sp.]